MPPQVSVIIPAHNEVAYIGACLDSVRAGAAIAALDVEGGVVLNRCVDTTECIARSAEASSVVFDEPCIAAVRNAGIRASSGQRVLTIDSDSRMQPKTLERAAAAFDSAASVGGDTGAWPERMFIGIFLSLLSLLPVVLRHRVAGGVFWFPRVASDAIGGIDEGLLSAENVGFGSRLRAHGRTVGLRCLTLRRCAATTSCRKFDQFGDWYIVCDPRMVRRILSGTDRGATERHYYKTGRS